MARVGLERLLHGGEAGLSAQELVGQQATLLVQQVGAARRLFDPGQLEVDEPQRELEVAPLAVPAARVRERLLERRDVDVRAAAGLHRHQGLEGLRVVGIQLEGRQGGRDVDVHGGNTRIPDQDYRPSAFAGSIAKIPTGSRRGTLSC